MLSNLYPFSRSENPCSRRRTSNNVDTLFSVILRKTGCPGSFGFLSPGLCARTRAQMRACTVQPVHVARGQVCTREGVQGGWYTTGWGPSPHPPPYSVERVQAPCLREEISESEAAMLLQRACACSSLTVLTVLTVLTGKCRIGQF